MGDLERRAAHREVTRERVAQAVPADVPQPGTLARVGDWSLRLAVRPHLPGHVAEHERPAEMTVGLQRRTDWIQVLTRKLLMKSEVYPR